MKKSHLLPLLLGAIVIAIIVSVVVGSQNYLQLKKYMDAGKLISKKEFARARAEYEKLGEFKDSKRKIIESYYNEGKHLLSERNFDGAIEAYINAGDYKDSQKKIKDVRVAEAKYLIKNDKFIEAANIYAELGNIKDNQKTLFKYAKYLIENNRNNDAVEVLKGIEDYEGAKELLESITEVPEATSTPAPQAIEENNIQMEETQRP